jgi:hypothetical protein
MHGRDTVAIRDDDHREKGKEEQSLHYFFLISNLEKRYDRTQKKTCSFPMMMGFD